MSHSNLGNLDFDSDTTIASTDDIKNEQIVLTRKEKLLAIKLWRNIPANLNESGLKFFVHFFGGYPEYQRMFRDLVDATVDELHLSKRLEAHGYSVLSSVTSMIENLDNMEYISNLFFEIGKSHFRHHLKVSDLQNFRESILHFVTKVNEEDLYSQWNNKYNEVWKKILNIMMAKIADGINDAEQASLPPGKRRPQHLPKLPSPSSAESASPVPNNIQ